MINKYKNFSLQTHVDNNNNMTSMHPQERHHPLRIKASMMTYKPPNHQFCILKHGMWAVRNARPHVQSCGLFDTMVCKCRSLGDILQFYRTEARTAPHTRKYPETFLLGKDSGVSFIFFQPDCRSLATCVLQSTSLLYSRHQVAILTLKQFSR